MAIKVSLINMKGGVGKSTLSVNLAWHYAAYSDWLKKVLVVDLDPQFNASQYLVGVTKYQEHLTDGKPTMWEILEQHTRTLQVKSGSLIQKMQSEKSEQLGVVEKLTSYHLGLNLLYR